MVTSRSLRRAARRNPALVKTTAGIVAGVIGMSTAAYAVLHVVKPYQGNGARSAAWPQEEQPSPTDSLIASLLDIVPVDSLYEFDQPSIDTLFYSIPSGAFVTSIVDGLQGGGGTGGNTPPPDGEGGGGSGGGSDPLLPWDGGLTPPPGGGSGGNDGWNTPGIGITPPAVVIPDLGVDPACPVLAPPPALAPNLGGLEPTPSEAGDAEAEGDEAAASETTEEDSCSAGSAGSGGQAGEESANQRTSAA